MSSKLLTLLALLLLGLAPLEQDDAAATYNGTWHVITCPDCAGGSFHATATVGDWFKIVTTPGLTALELHYLPGSIGARVRVKVDGVGPIVTLDDSLAFTVTVPADGRAHRVKVIFKGSDCTGLACPKLTLDSYALEP